MQELNNKQVVRFLLEDRYRIFRHLGFLFGFLLLLYNSSFSNNYTGLYKYYSLFSVYSVFVVMFYLNMYVLVPYFFFKARYVLYLIFLTALVAAGLLLIKNLLFIFLGEQRLGILSSQQSVITSFYGRVLVAIPCILLTTLVKLFQRWAKDNERISELKSLTLKMELTELRNQISPHFLFNMLNNVKSLMRSNPEKASMVIIELSEFLRYQLYENNQEKTLLSTEITFLTNFLNLEKIRRDNLTVRIDNRTEERIFRNVFVPPNLFTVFVENAVKHSAGITNMDAQIRISFEVIGNRLHFVCRNSMRQNDFNLNKNNSGLGLANIRRRLELLYPGKHILDLTSKEEEYIVNLTIPI